MVEIDRHRHQRIGNSKHIILVEVKKKVNINFSWNNKNTPKNFVEFVWKFFQFDSLKWSRCDWSTKEKRNGLTRWLASVQSLVRQQRPPVELPNNAWPNQPIDDHVLSVPASHSYSKHECSLHDGNKVYAVKNNAFEFSFFSCVFSLFSLHGIPYKSLTLRSHNRIKWPILVCH